MKNSVYKVTRGHWRHGHEKFYQFFLGLHQNAFLRKVVRKDFREIFPITGKNWKDLSSFCWKEKERKVSKISSKELLKLLDFEIAIRKSNNIEFRGENLECCHFFKFSGRF